METQHISVGARGSLRLVEDDVDRYALLDALSERLEDTLLSHCLMDTHTHLAAEGAADRVTRAVEAAFASYLRGFNRRHERKGDGLLRGPITPLPKREPFELMRAIRYVHANPVKTQTPLVPTSLDYRWSSERAYAGLTLDRRANVGRALELLGGLAGRVLPHVTFSDIEPVAIPLASPDQLLVAAADVYGVPPWELPARSRGRAVTQARALFLQLGRLESYQLRQLAPFLRRSRARVTELLQENQVGSPELRMARTLVRRQSTSALAAPAALPV